MGSILSPVSTTAPEISTFGPGGQQYIASFRGGFNVTTEQMNPLFSFRATDDSVANARQLTNLQEALKIGSTMAFRAVKLGVRVISFTNGALDPDVAANMKKLLASAEIVITAGSNDTKIAEFSGLDLMEPLDYVAAHATKPNSGAGLGGGIGWIPLEVPLEFQPNCNIGGYVRFTRAVPSNCLPDNGTPTVGFVVVLQGLKVVKS